LTQKKYQCWNSYPTYSSYFALCTFHLSKTKNSFKECYFESLHDVHSNASEGVQEHGAAENCIMMNFKTCTPHQIPLTMIKSRRLRLAGHVAYRVFVEKPEGKRSLGRLRHRWEDNIKMDLKETGWVWTVFIWLRVGTCCRLL
jgi:hypothetical protein